MGRKLKNFEKYKEKLLCYALAIDIDVEYGHEEGDGRFVPTKRKIVIDEDLDQSTEIATLLHELGHSTDETLYNKRTLAALDRAYPAFYAEKATEEQKLLVLAVEQRAWKFARGIAKNLRIPLGDWFSDEESSGLRDYMEF